MTEHIEDLIFNEGVKGTRKAIDFLRNVRDMLAGHASAPVTTTVKWDGAPAVFAGIDPTDGQFFVAKKGVFNKNPKVYKTPDDVKADTSGDLQNKLLIALEEFKKLGIKSGVYQGDLMFTKSDLSNETIDGEKYITFQPNTIVYAVPADSHLAKTIRAAKIGVVWHTVYSGNSFDSMSASFGEDIVKNFKSSRSIWQDDATYKDVSGNATFTKADTDEITKILSDAGRTFQRVPGRLIDAFHQNDELLLRTKTFNNTFVRAGKIVNPKTHARQLVDYIHTFYQKEIDKKKTERAKDAWIARRRQVLSVFSEYRSSDFENLFTLMNLLVDAKQMIVDKMNNVGGMNTFVRTRSGFRVTGQEGFVAIDHVGDAIKLVDRMEFSRANFSPDVIKGWER